MHAGIFIYKGTCTRAGELVVKRSDDKKVKRARKRSALDTATKKRRKRADGNNTPTTSLCPMVLMTRGIASRRKRHQVKHTTKGGEGGGRGEGSGEGSGERAGKGQEKRGRKIEPSVESSSASSSREEKYCGQSLSVPGSVWSRSLSPRRSVVQRQRNMDKDVVVPATDNSGAIDEAEQSLVLKDLAARAVEDSLDEHEAGAWQQILFGLLLNLPWVAMLVFTSRANIEYVQW